MGSIAVRSKENREKKALYGAGLPLQIPRGPDILITTAVPQERGQ